MNAPTEQTDDAGPIRCADCRHRVTTEHPVLTDCAKGIRAPGAGGLWWSTCAESLSGPERKRILNPLSVGPKRPSNGGFATDGGRR
jgi:hypothetical protein